MPTKAISKPRFDDILCYHSHEKKTAIKSKLLINGITKIESVAKDLSITSLGSYSGWCKGLHSLKIYVLSIPLAMCST